VNYIYYVIIYRYVCQQNSQKKLSFHR
jgi:hypothetical protein